MEFPHLGKHCNEPSCKRLDFLPVKCDSCGKVFCSSHFNYERHDCPGAHKKNVQVPICPLCGEPVPTAPGVAPDLTVGQHIDQQCKSDTKKIFTNRCSYKGCKRKELIPVTCSQCRRNYCLRHRHTVDHECKQIGADSSGKPGTSLGHDATIDHKALAANAAEYRRSNKPTTLFNVSAKPNTAVAQRPYLVQNIQGNMTEDEALARALALSIMELDESADRNRRNETAASQRNANTSVPVGGRDGEQANGKDKCSLS